MLKALITIVALITLTGCSMFTKDPVKDPIIPGNKKADQQQQQTVAATTTDAAKTVEKQATDTSKASGTIDAAASSIKASAASIDSKVSVEDKPKIQPDVKNINTNADAITAESKKLDDIAITLSKTSGQLSMLNTTMGNISKRYDEQVRQIEALQKAVVNKEQEIATLKSDYNKTLQMYMTYLIIAGVIIVAIAIALGMTGNVKAFGGAFAGGALICVAMGVMAMTKWGWVMGLVGGVGFAVMFGSLVWYVVDFIKAKRQALVAEIALRETVETTEAVKAHLTTEAKDTLFGDMKKGITGLANHLQSDSTKSIVREIRKQL